MINRRQFIIGAVTCGAVSISGCAEQSPTEAATEEWIRAGANGDAKTQQEVLHPASTAFEPDQESYSVQINEITEVSQDEAAELSPPSEEQLQSTVDEITQSITVDEVAFVYVDFTFDGRESETVYLLLDDDGWKIYTAFIN